MEACTAGRRRDFCHRLVFHGRDVCTARTKPYCDKCCLADICKKMVSEAGHVTGNTIKIVFVQYMVNC